MARNEQSPKPKTFFLNETHELAPAERGGGGRLPDYGDIPWAQRGKRIAESIHRVMKAVESSKDPLRKHRFFVLADPVAEVEKRSKDVKKAPDGTFLEPTSYGSTHGRVFDRLGLDLLQVTPDGQAIVHGDRERMEQLSRRTAELDSLGLREQSRWVTINAFETIPFQLRVDADWLKSFRLDEIVDVVFELQPVLGRVDADTVLRAIAEILSNGKGEKLSGVGTDFSGRFWCRGLATPRNIRLIAKDFFSVQSLHGPLYSLAAQKKGRRASAQVESPAPATPPANAKDLPCVAIVDLGVPSDHRRLTHYRRGQFIPQDAPRTAVGDHGAFVASRAVFGECASDDELTARGGECSFYDAIVADFPTGPVSSRVNDKIVLDALRGVNGAAPDVRVFNLSFGDTRPLHAFAEVERREKRLLLQDLDNFIFATDSIVVVAAGNSAAGVAPANAYPDHAADPNWALGPWASGYNTLVCGSFVDRVSANGLVTKAGWPSPFSRVGPGIGDAPVPSFCAEGGNTDNGYRFQTGLGVWGYNGAGLPEDRVGTSMAAPLLAREAALTLNDLQQYCAPGTQPFGVTVRAFLALTAQKTNDDETVAALSLRTLGHGKGSRERLLSPTAGTAVILWQGTIGSSKDKTRVQLPIPKNWLNKASRPVLRLAIASDLPVNEVAQATWACRRLKAVLHLGPDATYLRAPGGEHSTYPLIVREYNLKPYGADGDKLAEGDMWLLELSYDDIFVPPPGVTFNPAQRVAFAAELLDTSDSPVDPQESMQRLPAAETMIRLGVQETPIRTPLIVRTRGM